MIDQNLKDYFDLMLKTKHPYKDAALDFNHLMLLFGTVTSQKPSDVLELGIGTGAASLTILAGLMYNEKPFNYTCVDNLYDLGGNLPQGIIDTLKNQNVNIVISNEQKFAKECPDNSVDLILSDADHYHSGEWCKEYLRICRPNGIIFAHDVCNEGYPSLKNYIEMAKELNLPYYVFNAKSLPTEGCHTGFIMIINKK